MEILLVFLFLLAVITLVGHGIWVLIAAVFRALRGAQPNPPPERFFCDQCGTQLPAQHSPCAVCQQHTSATQMTREPENDLTATERQLRRFQAQGVLDAEKFDWLLRVVEYERHRLRGVPPTGIPEMPGQTMPETVTATEDPLPAPIDVPVTVHRPVPPMPATRPRKSVLEMLTSFMEERNIRWGEIIGGLLIVGCSLALVISFWSQIEQIPLLKFFIFTAMTGAFAGLGFYSEHRWKLPQTSRGLLITAMLLVPLNFLAIAAFSNEVSPNSSFVLITEVISFALFSLIVYRAGIVLTPRWAWALTLGIIGPSALQLLIHHTTDTTASMVTSSLFSALPILCAHLVSAVIWRRAQNEESRDPVFAYSALTLFSVSFFATIVAFCFAIFKTGNFLSSLSQFAPLVSLLAIPVLVIGAILRRRFAEISWLNLTAHSLGLLGSFVMGAALVLAWPQPETLIFVALINFAALTTLAFAYALPLGHLLALPCLLIAEVLSANLWFGKISQPSDSQSLLNAISSAFTGTALAFLFVPLALGSEMLYRRQHRAEGRSYLIIAALTGLLSLVLVTIFGFGQQGDPHHITWVYLLFAASAFYGAKRLTSMPASITGLALALLATLQSLIFIFHLTPLVTLLSYATAAFCVSVLLHAQRLFAAPSRYASLLTSVAALSVLINSSASNTSVKNALFTFWVAGLWLLLSWSLRSALLFTFFQFALAVAVILFVNPPSTEQESWNEIMALSGLSLGWVLLRLMLTKRGVTPQALPGDSWQARAAHLLYPRWPTGDHIIAGFLLFGFLMNGFDGITKAIDHIILPRDWQWEAHWLTGAPAKVWLIWGLLVATFGAGLWNRAEKYSVAGLYWLGLIAAITIGAQFHPTAPATLLMFLLIGVLHQLLTALVWRQREGLSAWAGSIGVRRPAEANWLVLAHEIVMFFLMILATIGVLFFDRIGWRLLAGLSVAGLAGVAGLLSAQQKQKAFLQKAAFLLGFLALVFCGWSMLSPLPADQLLTRLVIVCVAAVIGSEVIGLWGSKNLVNGWEISARQVLPLFFGTALISLCAIFALEFTEQTTTGNVELPMPAIVALMGVLLLLGAQAVIFAIKPQFDPWQLSERGRMKYIYAAEGFLALFFLHIRLTMPWLFGGFFQRYWPFGIVFLSFVGVGLGEILRRRGRAVLAEPLHNTGFFLPLLPSLAFWAASSSVNYSGLLIVVGILYASIAILRQSLAASALACVAANGALWHYLGYTVGHSLFSRPQLWLAPFGLSILGAAYFNRARLTATQMVNVRYAALILIYVSSTAEIFLHGVASSPWQPLVLMLLSAAGVLLGMFLRVRAFLYLGASFLLVSVVAIIWQASTNFGWTWLWYVTGIVLGLAIILLFALFEKKRAQLLQLVEGLKGWEA